MPSALRPIHRGWACCSQHGGCLARLRCPDCDPKVAFIDEPTGTEARWRNLTQPTTFTPKVWNDAYLAAFAELAGLELVTFDKGFSKFPNVRCPILP